MENQQIIAIRKKELMQLMAEMTRRVARELRSTPADLRYLKFPEDIKAITGGYISESTIRGWKSAGYLRTFKIGTKSFVLPEDWEWFLVNHRKLMQKNPRNRGKRLAKKEQKK